MTTDTVLIWLTDSLIYLANGGLAVLYFLADRAPHLAAIIAALLIAATFDRMAQQEAVFAPGRYGPGPVAPASTPRTAQTVTLVALGMWLAATWTFGPPVPFIGALMWAAGFLLLFIMPQQRWSLLWTMKGYLILYSLAILGFRLMLWQSAQLSPAELAEVFGGARSAGQVIAQNTGTLATIGTWLLWVIMPAGFFAVFLQNMVANQMNMVGPLQGAQDVIAALRTRGNQERQG